MRPDAAQHKESPPMADGPDINAVLDKLEAEETAVEAEVEAVATEEVAADEEHDEEIAPDPWEAGADTFERPYVEGLRRENQRYRQRAKEFLDAFDGHSDGDRKVLLDVVREIRDSPQSAAQRLAQIAQAITGATPQQQEAAGIDPSQPLTAEAIARIIDDRLSARDAQRGFADQQRAQEAAVADVYADAAKLGYEEGTPEIIELLWLAANETDSDLTKAHSILSGRRQKYIDEYLARKAKDSDSTPDMTTPGGSSPSGENKITGLDGPNSAKAALLASGLLDK